MRHDVWIEVDTREEWVCRWVCNTCGGRGSWADAKNRDRVQEASLAHADRAEDIEAHLNGDLCCDPDCEDCEHPVTEWDRAQSLIDDRLGKG